MIWNQFRIDLELIQNWLKLMEFKGFRVEVIQNRPNSVHTHWGLELGREGERAI